jgi:hypothetical protein
VTLDEARALIGNAVVYLPSRAHIGVSGGQLEEGVITSVNDAYVFVRYGADKHSKATVAEDLVTVP